MHKSIFNEKRISEFYRGIYLNKMSRPTIYTRISDEQYELRNLQNQVIRSIAKIYRLKQESVRGETRGDHGMVRYHMTLDGEYYRYNLRGDTFEGCSDTYVGHWDGTTLDRESKKPTETVIFPSFYEYKEFTGMN